MHTTINAIPLKNLTRYFVLTAIVLVALTFVAAVFMAITNSGRLSSEEREAGLTLERKTELLREEAQLQAALADLPENTSSESRYSTIMSLANVQYERAAYTHAIQTIKLIPEQDRNFPGAWFGLAKAYHKLGNGKLAIYYAKLATSSQSANPAVWLLYANLAKAEGLTESDLNNLYTEALEKTSSNPEIAAAYEQFLEETGHKEGSNENNLLPN